jgi:hypothetical protein
MSRAVTSMPHVDVQKPEVISTPGIPNGASPIPQAEVNNEMSVNGLPVWPKSQNVSAISPCPWRSY